MKEEAVEISNEVLKDGADEGMAIATSPECAGKFFANKETNEEDRA